MKQKTLKQFIDTELRNYQSKGDGDLFWPARAYVRERNFESLYVRFTQRAINKVIYRPTFDIANVEVNVKHRGKGIFTALVHRIKRDYPALPIYVESVLSERFVGGLIRMGFERVNYNAPVDDICPCLFFPPHKKLITKRGAPNEVAESKVQEAPLLPDA